MRIVDSISLPTILVFTMNMYNVKLRKNNDVDLCVQEHTCSVLGLHGYKQKSASAVGPCHYRLVLTTTDYGSGVW